MNNRTLKQIVNNKKKELEYKFCKKENKYRSHNRKRINFVMDKVYKKQLGSNNVYENKLAEFLSEKDIKFERQVVIPVLSTGGYIQHLYIADFVLGDTIVEVDGKSHKEKEQIDWDKERDTILEEWGYNTIRIPTNQFQKNMLECALNKFIEK